MSSCCGCSSGSFITACPSTKRAWLWTRCARLGRAGISSAPSTRCATTAPASTGRGSRRPRTSTAGSDSGRARRMWSRPSAGGSCWRTIPTRGSIQGSMRSSETSSSDARGRLANPEGQARARLGYLLSKLASGAPAPASGSAAATVLMLSAALLQKVAVRSDRWDGSGQAHAEAEALRLRAEELIHLDAVAFNAFRDAARSGQDIYEARDKTIDIPLEIAQVGVRVVDLGHRLEASGNQNLRADAVAAAILAHSAVTVAAMLVQVNLTPGAGDRRSLEANRLLREVSGSVRRRAARGRSGDRDRASEQSPDNDRPSPVRSDRDVRSAPSAAGGPASGRIRSASDGSRSIRRSRPRGGSR